MLSEDEFGKLAHTDRFHQHTYRDALVRARFGWDTSAISGTDADDVWTVVDLVKVVGYIWELHSILNSLAETRLRSSLESGHFHVIEKIVAEWRLDELRHVVGDTTELLDYSQAKEERKERWALDSLA